MPIYTYSCKDHGSTDVLVRGFDGREDTYWCPECGSQMSKAVTAPAKVFVSRDWNEKANDWQRNPYDQAKAQLNNMNRMAQEKGKRPIKISEETIQATAASIQEAKDKPQGSASAKKVSAANRMRSEAIKERTR